MSIPSGVYPRKKIAGAVAYYGTPATPTLTIIEDEAGYCDFVDPDINCTLNANFHLDNPNSATLDTFNWTSTIGTVNNHTTISPFVTMTSDTTQNGTLTCNVNANGVPTVITYDFTLTFANLGILDIDNDGLPDESLSIVQGAEGNIAMEVTEDADSINIDTDGNGIADMVIPKPSKEDE